MKKALLVVICAASIFVAWCSTSTQTAQTIPTTSAKNVKIGLIAPLSGPASTYGEDYANAVKMAVEKHNTQHADKAIELIVEDGQCNGAAATSAAQKLITVDNVALLLGGWCSSEAVAIGKIAQANSIVSLVPYPQSPNISKIGNYIFRFANGLQGWEMLGNVIDKHFNNVLIISEKTEYAQSISQVAKTILKGKIKHEISFETAEKDFDIIATRVKDILPGIEAIIIMAQTEASTSNIIKSFHKAGIQQAFTGKIIGYPFMSSRAFLDNVGPELATNLYNITFGPDTSKHPEGKKVLDDFMAKHTLRSMNLVPQLVTEAVWAVSDAIQKGAASSEDFYTYFSSITPEHPRTGIFGSYYFSGSDAIGVPYFMEKIDNGVARVVSDFE